MTQNERLEKFAKLVSNEPSNFLAKLDHYKTNKKRLDQSAKVAVNVLEALKDKGCLDKDGNSVYDPFRLHVHVDPHLSLPGST